MGKMGAALSNSMKPLFLCGLVGLSCLGFSQSPLAGGAAEVIPRPQIAHSEGGLVKLSAGSGPLQVSFRGTSPAESSTCAQGLQLLSKRLTLLGAGGAALETDQRNAQVVGAKLSPQAFSRMLRSQGAPKEITGKRLEQTYTLVCKPADGKQGSVQITACSDLGIYYALVSLCQLLEKSAGGGIALPVVRIADWPEVGLRLSKTSASTTPLPELQDYASWLPLYKLNVMGLQFHGTNSNDDTVFRANVKALCSRARQEGILETIVYFCPFRGKGYDFNSAVDQQRYAGFLQWMLEQGADGVEVDYNDWPGRATPIENVINLACRAVAEKNTQAYVLYCPPSRGTSVYRGPASAEMTRILSLVPTNVWPLWTGMATNNALIEKPLDPSDVERWTRAAGRRPFLWVNRVGPRDKYNNRPFARPLPELPGAFVFRGDFLPKELNQLFEGVHFNTIPITSADTQMLAYMATAADYVWNPQAWEAVDSCRRAKRFVEIMLPLVQK